MSIRKTTKRLFIHCTATPWGKTYTRDQYLAMHKARGFSDIGYHRIVLLDGTVIQGLPWDEVGAHVSGHNHDSAGLAYEGGLDRSGKPCDTLSLNPIQNAVMDREIEAALDRYHAINELLGHRDISPDKNGNGIVDSFERIKECPCFDAIPRYKHFLIKRGRI